MSAADPYRARNLGEPGNGMAVDARLRRDFGPMAGMQAAVVGNTVPKWSALRRTGKVKEWRELAESCLPART
jgi:hypothetical protein